MKNSCLIAVKISQWKNLEGQKERSLPDMVIGKKMADASIFDGAEPAANYRQDNL